MTLHPLNALAVQLRLLALAADELSQEVLEVELGEWRKSTVYPAAVDRWLLAVAEASR